MEKKLKSPSTPKKISPQSPLKRPPTSSLASPSKIRRFLNFEDLTPSKSEEKSTKAVEISPSKDGFKIPLRRPPRAKKHTCCPDHESHSLDSSSPKSVSKRPPRITTGSPKALNIEKKPKSLDKSFESIRSTYSANRGLNTVKSSKKPQSKPLLNTSRPLSKSTSKTLARIARKAAIRTLSKLPKNQQKTLAKKIKNPEKKGAKKDIVSEDSDSSSEFEEDTSGDEDSGSDSDGPRHEVDIEIGNTLKRVLEQDHDLINKKNKLAVLPAQPTVISILESWVLHYTNTQLNDMPDKRQRNNKATNILEKTITDINLCRETAEGIRVYFDHILSGLLLYAAERHQYNILKAKATVVPVATDESITIKDEIVESDVTIKEETEDSEYAHLPPFKEQEGETDKACTMTDIRRKLRSSRLSSLEDIKPSKPVEETKQETGNVSSLNSLASTSSRCSSPRGVTLRMSVPPINSAHVNELLEKASKWRLVKEGVDKNSLPSNTYGAIHLVRLFVRLPDLLQRSDITDAKLKVVLKYIDMLLSYMEMHKEWFGEQFYMSKASFEESNTNQ